MHSVTLDFCMPNHTATGSQMNSAQAKNEILLYVLDNSSKDLILMHRIFLRADLEKTCHHTQCMTTGHLLHHRMSY